MNPSQQQRTVAIVQARMKSTRLPGKVLAPVAGQPLLALIVERVRQARLVDEWVIATTRRSQDDAVEQLAKQLNVPCFRGDEADVLDRFYQAAKAFQADTVVRLTGDNPLVDAGFVDWMIEQFRSASPPCDYLDSSLSKTFPVGLSMEAFSFAALAIAWQEDTNHQWREHVTPYFYRHPERFRLKHVASTEDYSALRWTVDTPEDLAFVRRVFEHVGDAHCPWPRLLEVVSAHPEWLAMNGHVAQRTL